MAAANRKVKNIAVWLLTMAVCLTGWAVTDARAADEGDLVVEQVYLREILRSYSADPAGFDAENGAQALAELFTATVGLNYYGEGNPGSYFAKDITDKYEQEPYVPANLLASYDVPIHPVNGRAEATNGQTWKIHVFLTGYNAEAVGAVPVYHYVWQDNGSWWAVRDDVPYYRVSYKGMSAAAAENAGVRLVWARTGDVSAAGNSGWVNLTAESNAAAASGSAVTYVAAQGQSAIFAALNGAGEPMAISDYVRGSGSAGPVLRSKTLTRADGSYLAAGEKLIPGESYRVRLVYRDGLKVAQRGTGVSVAAITAEGSACGTVTDVVWYGSDEYLTRDDYNPETVEFTVTAGSGSEWCLFALRGVVGFENGLAPAAVWQKLEYTPAPTAAPTAEPVQTPTAAPVITQAPVVTAEPAPAVTPEIAATAEPTVEPTAEPLPTPEPTPAPLSFAPEALVTWGDLALRLWDAQGKVDVVNDPNQTDLYRASCWAASVGLTEGWADGSLTAEVALSREQMACALYAYAAYLGRDVSATDDLALRPDGATVSPWAVTALRWAVGSGVLTPAMDGSVAPGATVSHGQLDWMLSIIQ